MDDRFTPVLFITLTTKNRTKLVKLLDNVSRFVVELGFKTKTHLLTFRGVELGLNPHEHLIIAVPNSELEYFEERLGSFKPWKSWRFKTLDFQRFDETKTGRCFSYVCEKHAPLQPYVVCPKRLRSCRKGRCSHTQEKIRRLVNPDFEFYTL